ncbi:MAG: hypothetical protein OXC18_22450 [Desulfurellaceae bacterium]|nr:hypothetical protein [Desulfurellaceae bacterium]
MKKLTASEARKNWFQVLDEVAAGEVVVLERKGEMILLSMSTTLLGLEGAYPGAVLFPNLKDQHPVGTYSIVRFSPVRLPCVDRYHCQMLGLVISLAKSSLEQEQAAPREESAAFRCSTLIGYREGLLCMLPA